MLAISMFKAWDNFLFPESALLTGRGWDNDFFFVLCPAQEWFAHVEMYETMSIQNDKNDNIGHTTHIPNWSLSELLCIISWASCPQTHIPVISEHHKFKVLIRDSGNM